MGRIQLSFCGFLMRLSENAHLPFDKLMALSKVDPSRELRVDAEQCRSIEGLRYPHPSSLRRTAMYASFLGISSRSKGCGMDIFHQPLRRRFFGSLNGIPASVPLSIFNTVDVVQVFSNASWCTGVLKYWSVARD